eukprot:1481940-Alexandrium_andersonii.AAC.1
MCIRDSLRESPPRKAEPTARALLGLAEAVKHRQPHVVEPHTEEVLDRVKVRLTGAGHAEALARVLVQGDEELRVAPVLRRAIRFW